MGRAHGRVGQNGECTASRTVPFSLRRRTDSQGEGFCRERARQERPALRQKEKARRARLHDALAFGRSFALSRPTCSSASFHAWRGRRLGARRPAVRLPAQRCHLVGEARLGAESALVVPSVMNGWPTARRRRSRRKGTVAIGAYARIAESGRNRVSGRVRRYAIGWPPATYSRAPRQSSDHGSGKTWQTAATTGPEKHGKTAADSTAKSRLTPPGQALSWRVAG
jgi:hypothetical protein